MYHLSIEKELNLTRRPAMLNVAYSDEIPNLSQAILRLFMQVTYVQIEAPCSGMNG